MTRPIFRRLYELDRLLQSGRCPNSTALARLLEVTRRTVQRDIEFLRSLGAPVEYDYIDSRYCYTEPFRLFAGAAHG